MRDELIAALAGRAERALELQSGLTSFPALSPENGGEGEERKAVWLEERLRAFGLKNIEHVDAPDSRVPSGRRPNMIVRVPGRTRRMLWVLAHLDVVPPGELSLWKSDPWTVTRDPADPDLIYGRGVEDNQQAAVSAILLAAELKEKGITPELGLGIILVADEETGNKYGIEHVLAERPDLIAPDDLVMVPDYGTVDGALIEVAEKSTLWVKVTVTGAQCHASTPDEGKNALVAASDMILHVQSEMEARFPERNSLFTPDRSTITPTRHDANVPNVNTMPGKDVFFVDSRILPHYDLDEVLAAMRAFMEGVAARHGVGVELEVVNREAGPAPTPVDSPVVVALKDAVFKVYGIRCREGGVGGGTVAKQFRARGINAAVWCRVLDNCHVPNEGARLSHAVGDAQVYAHMLFASDSGMV
ncbi:MAG: diaminopimelate aminotransferase [Desulfovibrionaceae bacterium]|nr:MAG: diaminopimelate aminotransferase [Desulfovibrionaceae bacterium]